MQPRDFLLVISAPPEGNPADRDGYSRIGLALNRLF
jgi:hypothetical protein